MEQFYVDSKGRRRWHCNDRLADLLKQLHDYLVIGNYDESHAARYPRLAHSISRHPESVMVMKEEDRLQEIAGVSTIIAGIISELLETGTCKKMDEGDDFFTPPPRSVLEMTAIPSLGAKTAKMFYQDHGFDSLVALKRAAANGTLITIKGVGKSLVAKIEQA